MPPLKPMVVSIFSLIITTTIASTPQVAPADVHELFYNCYRLECLWHALYGPNHPLANYLRTYKSGINTYALQRQASPHRTIDEASQLMTAQLESQLIAVKEQAARLLDQYELTSTATLTENSPLVIPAPSSYTAAPLPATTPATQEAALQQILLGLQDLHAQQSAMPPAPHGSTLKEQMTLFVIGVAFLAVITGLIHHRITGNIRVLHAKTEEIHQQLTAPHSDTEPCGILAQLECAQTHLRQGAPAT
ncbi:MAG: hypothetical protein QG604_870 [Candidatus Dependentiae bacterium]|nr:hypothetical protein [Candidatus Dependentiae bacterium]